MVGEIRFPKAAGRRWLAPVLLSAAILLTQQLTSSFTADSYSSYYGLSRRSQQRSSLGHAFVARETKLGQAFPGSNGSGSDNESWWSPSEEKSSRLRVRRRVKSAFKSARNKTSKLHQSNNNNSSEKTWSRPGEKSSSLGVRKRVKAVLKKARSRTGVSNGSEDSAGLWIAEVASIGGLPESDLIIKTEKKNGANANGSANGSANGVSNGASTSTQSLPSIGDLDVERKDGSGISSKRSSSDFDGLLADVPTPPPEPLPFKLPTLSEEQKEVILAGERVQEQSKMGREGSGFVVVDVKAPPYVIWECLLDFEAYPELMKTVRAMEMFTSNKLTSGYHSEEPVPKGTTREMRHYGIPSVTRASFILSKFKLNIAAIHNYRPHPDGHYMVFNLDPECTNIVLQSATGIWHIQSNPDGRGEEYTRVWLLCDLKVSRLLPKFVVDYTAKRAMPRATKWLKPHVEALAEKWAEEQNDFN